MVITATLLLKLLEITGATAALLCDITCAIANA
jgi:hypothetical protein